MAEPTDVDFAGSCVCCTPNLSFGPGPTGVSPAGSDPAAAARGAQLVNTLASTHVPYPTLPRTSSTVGGQFDLQSQDYQLSVYCDLTYVKGWIMYLIRLDALVPAGTGGSGKVNWGPDPAPGATPFFSGSDWRLAKESTVIVGGGACNPSGLWFWDGSAWQNVPDAWQDIGSVKLFPIGIWAEGTVNKAQTDDGLWPEPIPAWGATEESLRSSVLPQWINTIQTTWTNKFDLKRQDCPSTDSNCCRYHPKIIATFTETTTFPIDLTKSIVLAGNKGLRSNVRAWSLGDDRKYLPAHEFGHLLGYPDEYSGGGPVDTSVNEDGATAGIDNKSLMGMGMNAEATAIVKARHFRVICWELSAMIDIAIGGQQCYGHVIKAVAPTS